MLKINNLQKKIIKISTVISLVMISSFFLINKVGAVSFISSDIEYLRTKFGTFDCQTIKDIAEDKEIDTNYYDSFILSYTPYSTSYNYLYFFNSENIHNVIKNGSNEIDMYGPHIRLWGIQTLVPLKYANLVTGDDNSFNYYKGDNYYIINNDYKTSNSVYLAKNFDCQLSEPTSYEFNEDIDVTDISKIKINFELPEDTSNLEVDINWTFDNLIDGGDGLFTTPYLEFKHSNGDITVSQSMDTLNGGHWFSDNYLATLLPDSDITEMSLVVDVVNATGLLNANFSSKFPYTISYEYIEEVQDYFITIDMDDYASISLIPKVYDIESGVSSSISSPIYKYGIYDIEIWEDLETKKVIDRWDNHSTSYFVYPMYSGYKNCVIHFIKKEVDASDRYIRFDSRYYIYVVKNYLNEEVTITNPNTGEDVVITDTSDLYKYDSPADSRFSFNSFLKPIRFIFESITNFYNNYCPEIVQYFFYLIFAFFVILVLIKIFL